VACHEDVALVNGGEDGADHERREQRRPEHGRMDDGVTQAFRNLAASRSEAEAD
jgi:hypothetical protein